MSKKMSEHKRLFKQYKAGFFKKVPMTEEQETILRKHYPFLFACVTKYEIEDEVILLRS